MDFIWTDEIVEKALRLTADGLSASKVAKEIGTTKNSVIGKLYRLREAKVSIPESRRAVCYGPVDIDGLAPTNCRYPLWEGSVKSGLYCGKKIRAKSWCEEHHRVVYSGPGERSASSVNRLVLAVA